MNKPTTETRDYGKYQGKGTKRIFPMIILPEIQRFRGNKHFGKSRKP